MIAALCALCVVMLAEPQPSSAAVVLALPHSCYPGGTHVAVVPATNANADHYLHPAHRLSFSQLHRLDGSGWLQFGSWHFQTGVAGAKSRHTVTFGYGINLFHSASAAQHALRDVKLKTQASKVAHVPSRRYRVVTARGTLLFVFLAYGKVEVEAYYEYTGTAPVARAKQLRHVFARQESHLVKLAKHLNRAARATATPVPTVRRTSTPTPPPTEEPTATIAPTVAPTEGSPTSTPTDTPTTAPTETPTISPTPTLAPVFLAVSATPQQPEYAPGDTAVIVVHVSNNNEVVQGASVTATFAFYQQSGSCLAITNSQGDALCSVKVPVVQPQGTTVRVSVSVSWTRGAPVDTTTSFQIG